MAKKRIKIIGQQRADIDPQLLVQILLAIGQELDGRPPAPVHEQTSPDVHLSAIEDSEAGL